MTTGLIGVTGATGRVGGRIATRLDALGARQRLIVRDPTRAPTITDAEVRQASGFGARDEMQAALVGVDTLMLISAGESPTRANDQKTAVDAAFAAGVQRVVYLSIVGASPTSTFTLGHDHAATEGHIRNTGLPYTFLRDNFYVDFLPAMVGPDGVIRGPAADGRIGGVTRDDIADVAAAALTGAGHEGKTYEVTGREAYTLGEAASVMADMTGKPIRYHNETLEEAYESRQAFGAPAWMVDAWVSSYLAMARGDLDVISDTVLRLTGHEPATIRDFLRAYPNSLDHVSGI